MAAKAYQWALLAQTAFFSWLQITLDCKVADFKPELLSDQPYVNASINSKLCHSGET